MSNCLTLTLTLTITLTFTPPSPYMQYIYVHMYIISSYIYIFLKACLTDLEESAEMELSEANSWNSVSKASDSQMKVNTWQTDESKATEQHSSFRLQQSKTNKSYVPCLADTGNYLSFICIYI